jgi:hypothetical protein
MKIAVALALLMAAVTTEALDLKGVSPGQSWDAQAIQDKLNANATGFIDTDEMRVKCDGSGCYGWAIYGNCPGNTIVGSKNGLVDTVSVEISINCYEKVASLMLQKYGPASKTLRQVKQNGFGARVNDVILIWDKGNQTLTYEKYEKIDQAFMLLAGPQKPEKNGTL